ncbi:MAG: trypsin-like peptidase domain-containing protein [Oribacterium sp.]|nr:trypsin-like peptidase domain-containing protein [Oribacterium sp.]MBP3803131.1 trypsin-like peptidase domain-containing protein [Oribacterium sp.]
MGENDFIKENIVGRKEGWKKTTRHYIRVAFSALLFGVLSAGTFAATRPLFSGFFHNEEQETVKFETEPVTEETESETETEPETRTEPETEPETTEEVTEPPETETTAETVPIEEVVRDEVRKYEYNIEDYKRLNNTLKQVALSADYALTEVRSRVTDTDLFGEHVKSGSSASGVIIARTSGEILILTTDSVLKDAGDIEVVFYGGRTYSASVKAVDETDGIAVVTVPLSTITFRDSQVIKNIDIGDSSMLQRGDMILAVGAPAGAYGSSTVGSVASVSYDEIQVDGYFKDMIADVDIDPKYGSFVINTAGELVGWFGSDEGDAEGYHRIKGISDYLDEIETISNGTRYPFLGIRAQELTSDITDAIPEADFPKKGLYIRSCIKNSPSYNAGIQNGDVLVKINDEEIGSMADYETALRKLTGEEQAVITIMRQNGSGYQEADFRVTVAGR